MQCAQHFWIPQQTPPLRDAVRTTVFHSTTHTTKRWCSAHNTFSFHNTHHHHVMQCAQQFFIPQHTPPSSDAMYTVVLDSTTHTHITWRSAHSSFGFHNTHTYITWCSAHNSFSFHNKHHHYVMQCAQQFFIPQHTPPSRDAMHTVVLDSTTYTQITWCSAHSSFGLHNTHTYITWCSAHNTFVFHTTHPHHVMQCAQ
jgi:hypothetical protein